MINKNKKRISTKDLSKKGNSKIVKKKKVEKKIMNKIDKKPTVVKVLKATKNQFPG